MMKQARTAWPDIQERAIQSGDFSEVERANQVMERMNTIAEKRASMPQERPPAPPSGPVVPSVTAPPAPAIPTLAAAKAPVPHSAIAELLKEADADEAMAASFGQPRYPTQALPLLEGQLEQGTAYKTLPEVGKEAVRMFQRAVPGGMDIPQVQYAPTEDPKRAFFLDEARKKRSRAAELMKGAGLSAGPAPAFPPPPVSAYTPPPPGVPPMEGEPTIQAAPPVAPPAVPPAVPPTTTSALGQGIENAIKMAAPALTNAANTAGAAAKEKFGDDAVKIVQSMTPFEQGAPEWEKEFKRRVEVELGERPTRTSVEKAILAILYGAASIGARWINHNWRGQIDFPDFSAEQKTYDARRSQIAREVGAEQRGATRASIAQAGADRRAAQALEVRKAIAEAQQKIDRFNAKVRELAVRDRAAARAQHAHGQEIAAKIDAEMKRLGMTVNPVTGEIDQDTYGQALNNIRGLAGEFGK
jgi:hypothetical protein